MAENESESRSPDRPDESPVRIRGGEGGTLAGVAIPNVQRGLLRARAVDVMGQLSAVRVAMLDHQADEAA